VVATACRRHPPRPRRRGAGDVTGLIAAAFTHRDSRSGDPDFHTHVVVSMLVSLGNAVLSGSQDSGCREGLTTIRTDGRASAGGRPGLCAGSQQLPRGVGCVDGACGCTREVSCEVARRTTLASAVSGAQWTSRTNRDLHTRATRASPQTGESPLPGLSGIGVNNRERANSQTRRPRTEIWAKG
jgi:hypothetical protein